MSHHLAYEDAVDLLNSLQSDTSQTESSIRPSPVVTRPPAQRRQGIERARSMLQELGLAESLEHMHAVLVAGTNGKGSTVAGMDAIFGVYRRQSSTPRRLRTGSFISPHVTEVRERIRVDGQPVSRAVFASCLHDLWRELRVHIAAGRVRYFTFLFLLAVKVFHHEAVSIAIFEAGIGGEYDVVNVISSPVATGVTTIQLDHTTTLGESLAEIAWHKGGIFRAHCTATTMPQVDEVLLALEDRAVEKGTRLHVVPTRQHESTLPWRSHNTALAWELASQVVAVTLLPVPPMSLSDEKIQHALSREMLPGRHQTIPDRHATGLWWFLDVAHTADSLAKTVAWFDGASRAGHAVRKALVFNQASTRRSGSDLLRATHTALSAKATEPPWLVLFPTNLLERRVADLELRSRDREETLKLQIQHAYKSQWEALPHTQGDRVVCSRYVDLAIESAREYASAQGVPIHALVTGCPHLVGAALTLLQAPVR